MISQQQSEAYHYHTALDGALRKVVRSLAKLDADGKEVPGSADVMALDPQSAEVRERFQRDVLDFWLKGRGRKKSGARAAPKKQSPSSH